MQACVFELVCVCIHRYACAYRLHSLVCVCWHMWAGRMYKVYKGGSVLTSGGVKALCVLALNAPLLVWRLYSFPLAAFLTNTHTCAHTHVRTHTHSKFHKQALVFKDGEKQNPGQKDFDCWHTL